MKQRVVTMMLIRKQDETEVGAQAVKTKNWGGFVWVSGVCADSLLAVY